MDFFIILDDWNIYISYYSPSATTSSFFLTQLGDWTQQKTAKREGRGGAQGQGTGYRLWQGKAEYLSTSHSTWFYHFMECDLFISTAGIEGVWDWDDGLLMGKEAGWRRMDNGIYDDDDYNDDVDIFSMMMSLILKWNMKTYFCSGHWNLLLKWHLCWDSFNLW